jgi:hypothetical protein
MSWPRSVFSALCLAVVTVFASLTVAQAADGYSAEARCAITKAYGSAQGRSSGEAIAAAISNCTARGGIRA